LRRVIGPTRTVDGGARFVVTASARRA